jgi:hypothetical protein
LKRVSTPPRTPPSCTRFEGEGFYEVGCLFTAVVKPAAAEIAFSL